MTDICIVGAGISGLTTAYRSQRSGVKVTVLEGSKRLGGALKTLCKDGYLLEYGPNSVLACRGFLNFIREIGLEGELVEAQPRLQRFIAKAEARGCFSLVALPRAPLALCHTRLLSLAAKARLFADPFLRRGTADDESIHDFFCRRLGPEFADYIVAPIISGIWAASIRELSTRASINPLWRNEKEYRSLLFALIAKKVSAWRRGQTPRTKTISFARGMEHLSQRLAELLCDTPVLTSTQVVPESLLDYDNVVLTSSAAHCASLLEGSYPGLAAAITAVPSASIGILHLGIRRDFVRHPVEGFGFLVPPIYRRTLRGVIFSSSLFPGRAPAGYHLLSCFLSSDPRDAGVRHSAVTELDELLGLAREPEVLDASYLPSAIPSYPVGHHRLQSAVECFHGAQNRIRIISSWYKGLSVAHRVQEALSSAEAMQ